jgi:hypothetical protein
MEKLPWLLTPLACAALWLMLVLLCGCSTVGRPMRHDPKSASGPGDSWHIESDPAKGPTYSCSFVEFDGRGDYINFDQHSDARDRVDKLATAQKVVLVFYCHGWQNNSQSGDVVEFNSFLGRLAASPAIKDYGYRVHGVYLSWRGNVIRPFVDTKSDFYRQTTKEFGAPIVNSAEGRKISWLGKAPEIASYYNRRRAAEHKVSAIPIARTIYTLASQTKAIDRKLGRTDLMKSSRVMVMGHSFGALVLERALGPASISALTERWPWYQATNAPGQAPAKANPLPIDFALFVNSAAPAIYAKETSDFLWAHHRALAGSGTPAAPVFISLTSSADQATGLIHPIGNFFAPLYRSLRRNYTNLLQTADGTKVDAPVHQSVFFNRTPGHQPLLVDHWIEEDSTLPQPPAVDHPSILLENLDYSAQDPLKFYTSPVAAAKPNQPSQAQGWKITGTPSEENKQWADQFNGLVPRRHESAYWFLRCNEKLIDGHNDCWSKTTMELYAALYRLVESQRLKQNGTGQGSPAPSPAVPGAGTGAATPAPVGKP